MASFLFSSALNEKSARRAKVGFRAQPSQPFRASARATEPARPDRDLALGVERNIGLVAIDANGWSSWTARAVTSSAAIARASTSAPLTGKLPLRRTGEAPTRATQATICSTRARTTSATSARRDGERGQLETCGVDQEQPEGAAAMPTAACNGLEAKVLK